MKKVMKKLVGLGLSAVMALGCMAGCGTETTQNGGTEAAQTTKDNSKEVKIGVLVADVSGEEALGFRDYYENYIADKYNVTFSYTDELKDAAGEKSAIEKYASQGYDAVISLSSNDRALQIEAAESNKIYYAVASGMLDPQISSTIRHGSKWQTL